LLNRIANELELKFSSNIAISVQASLATVDTVGRLNSLSRSGLTD